MAEQTFNKTSSFHLREPFNAVSHLTGAVMAVPAAVLLLVSGATHISQTIALAVYGFSLIGLFLASGLYHAISASPAKMVLLRKMDHAAIYILIAGTYTPFCLIAFEGFWRWGLLAIIWTLALVGIGVKMWVLNAPRWVTAGVYVAMGWLIAFAGREMLIRLTPTTMGWLLAGGLLYTFGAVIYATRKADFFPGVFGFHEVWHIFVLLGAAAHYAAVVSIL